MYNVINTIDPEVFARFNQRLNEAEQIVDKFIPNWNFVIPNFNYSFFGLSGGVDSSVMIVIMFLKHRKHFLTHGSTNIFCDTGNDPDAALELLDYIEELLGIEIVRIQEETLFGVIEKHGNFLPSPQQRWCTTRLKTEPYNAYLQKYVLKEGETVNTFIGINADEADRAQDLGIEGIQSFFPFVECGVTRDQITSIAVELSLMNKSYADGRSRSGCKNCVFMSKPELVSLYIEDKDAFAQGQSVELLPDGVEERIMRGVEGSLPPLGYYTCWPENQSIIRGKEHFEHLGTTGEIENIVKEGSISWDFFDKQKIPKKPKKAKKRCEDTIDMFGVDEIDLEEEIINSAVSYDERVLYVAVEKWYHEGLGLCFTPWAAGVPFKSKLITFSTSQSGLTNSLNGWWYHRLAAAKLNFDSEEQYSYRTHVTVYAIRFDEGIIPVMGKNHTGYTWFSDHAYCSVAKTVDAIQVAAQTHSSFHMLKNKRDYSWIELESAEKYASHAKDNPNRYGEFIGIGHFRPKEKADYEDSLDNNAKTARCFECSL
ncbi:phosphoadenosine phosphosulfate reductase family protein [Vibrio owensii]|uniref:phosphoadenosine phosphosulfate reductase domain-containing protein n=1 Tax=Vibrio owensii TaxID=696485 RepID=UPI0018F10A29|nr:phosphoadenosine phosphosulfate reductase family protein [Vibrio owensii]